MSECALNRPPRTSCRIVPQPTNTKKITKAPSPVPIPARRGRGERFASIAPLGGGRRGGGGGRCTHAPVGENDAHEPNDVRDGNHWGVKKSQQDGLEHAGVSLRLHTSTPPNTSLSDSRTVKSTRLDVQPSALVAAGRVPPS